MKVSPRISVIADDGAVSIGNTESPLDVKNHVLNEIKRVVEKVDGVKEVVCYTDFWSAYDEIFPETRHKKVGKETGKTSHIERFNLTMRQRVSRLVRKTLSFSKKLVNHIGAIWNFVHHYNSDLAPSLTKITTC